MNLTQEERIARHKSFLIANGELLSAFSWENYLAKGKGAVLVPEEDFMRADVPQLKGLRFHYLPLAEKDKEQFKSIFAEKELGWLATYNPDEKVILCILREGGGVSSYLFGGGRVKPSEAYMRKRAELS